MHEALIDYALSKPGAERTFPFGPDVLVIKVMGRMFALTRRGEPHPSFNLKCEPTRAIALRASYPAITPGYHMNKQHWNTVMLDGTLSSDELQRLIDHSYELILSSLRKSEREALQRLS